MRDSDIFEQVMERVEGPSHIDPENGVVETEDLERLLMIIEVTAEIAQDEGVAEDGAPRGMMIAAAIIRRDLEEGRDAA